ncbi:hypothetical protein, partial [Klebsiella pneumoniae]|uniref:hypothetical protein n=1 Tax=Klebsiella pneumoniae TaxID=573 RepID=UPI0013D241BB
TIPSSIALAMGSGFLFQLAFPFCWFQGFHLPIAFIFLFILLFCEFMFFKLRIAAVCVLIVLE